MDDLVLCCDGNIVESRVGCKCQAKSTLPSIYRIRLSKTLAGILRHYPDRFGVNVDSHGWASVAEIVRALRESLYPWLEEWHVIGVALHDPKGRYEISGGSIRARYGHSIPVAIEPLPGRPPARLYHGTPQQNLPSIRKKGITRGKRLKVHLTSRIEDAVETGLRHGSGVVVLVVDTRCLESKGVKVEKASKTVYTVDHVPPECIEKVLKP